MISYKQPYQGKVVTIVGDNAKKCAKSLFLFRRSRQLEGATEEQCEADVAARGYVTKIASRESQPVSKEPRRLKLKDVLNGTKALVSIIAGDIVGDAEIMRRAEICANCALISDIEIGCTSCSKNKLANYARDLAIKYGRNFIDPHIRTTKLKPNKAGRISKFYCKFCGCSCLNLVLSKGKHFLKKENNLRPKNCWVHSEVEP